MKIPHLEQQGKSLKQANSRGSAVESPFLVEEAKLAKAYFLVTIVKFFAAF